MTEHIASCSCGKLNARCDGDPDSIVQCHCSACKKKSGSAFGLGAYYPRDRVDILGVSQRFVRKAESGADFIQFFCPDCATTLFWTTERHPSGIGLAVGCMPSLKDVTPSRAVFDESRCAWLEPLNVPTFTKGRDSEQVR